MKRALLAALVFCGSSASAWESVCQAYPDPTLEVSQLTGGAACSPDSGPNTARQRWVGPLDEHRQLFEKARELAGIPAETSATQKLRVFTLNQTVASGTATLPTLTPADFAAAERVRVRAFTPGELAQLPDWSYSLWDWATGHESCPIDGVGVTADASACHDFASHMGPVNANHFLPLAGRFYAEYHQLALARAAACAQMKSALGTDVARFSTFAKACELEALTIEAVGQHYLQDAWSMGHMWQRWGSPDLTDFPGATADEKREKAVLIALVSGLLHGSRGVLQKLPAWTSYDVNDALCAPSSSVHYVHPLDGTGDAIGDDYLPLLAGFGGSSAYELQWNRLAQCAVSGVLSVYQAAGENHGAAQPYVGFVSIDPTSDACFGQRATNEAMLAAAAVNLKVAGQQTQIALDARTIGWMLPRVATSQGDVPVSATTKNNFRLQMQRVVSLTRIWAKKDPNGTQVADGVLGSFLGVQPNGAYVSKSPLASYLEPALPWPGNGMGTELPRAQALGRLFHRAHATDWCGAMDANALQALKAHVSAVAGDAEAKAAACEVCAEFTARHLRVGTDPTSYDTTREPLCSYLTASPAYVYQPGSASEEPLALATAYCGCP